MIIKTPSELEALNEYSKGYWKNNGKKNIEVERHYVQYIIMHKKCISWTVSKIFTETVERFLSLDFYVHSVEMTEILC